VKLLAQAARQQQHLGQAGEAPLDTPLLYDYECVRGDRDRQSA
jgi:hypothetical protein